jgi:hypothetical protein
MPRDPYQLSREEPQLVRHERMLNRLSVQEYLMAAIQKRKDADVAGISGPTRLEAAYDAILFSAFAVFSVQSYRVSAGMGHHKIALEGLAGSLGLNQSDLDEMEQLLEIRNAKYDGFHEVSEVDLHDALAISDRTLNAVEAWLQTHHPGILHR